MIERQTTGEAVAGLGGRVRVLRREAGMTLEELAVRSGVSRAMISKLERGEKSPTIAVAAKVASGFGMSLSTLLGDGEGGGEVYVTRRERQMVMSDPEGGFERRLLTPQGTSGLEFVRNEIEVGGESGEFPAHESGTVEYISVERGRLRATLGGSEYLLDEGDSVRFDADVTHRFDNVGDERCVYYLVVDHRSATRR